jgi:class 3 adenylate cyclase
LETLLDANPWPEPLRAQGAPLDYLWQFEVKVGPDQLWPYIIETSRLNRAIGLSKMEFWEHEGRLHGSSRNAFIRQQWVEVPWDWVAGRTLTSVREFSRGMQHVARAIYVLEPSATGTTFYVYFGFVPSGWLGRTIIKLGIGWLRKGYQRVLSSIEAEVAAGAPAAQIATMRADPEPLDAQTRQRVAGLRGELLERGVSEAAIDRIIEHIERGDETELYRIQLVPLARRWNVDTEELLIASLHATRIGLLDLSWDVVCPHCRGVRNQAATLGEVPAQSNCDVCDIDFETDVDDALEITFHVHSSIRQVPKVYYCSAEPSTKLHIHVQQRLAPGESRSVQTGLTPGRYRLRLRGDKTYRYIEVRGEGAARVTWHSAGDSDLEAGPEPVLELVNASDGEHTFVVENIEWADDALRPSRVFNLQEFRDLFSEQYLASDVQISIGEQTILFTDMVGSTTFYGVRGDPEAFMEVKRHFTEVYQEVRSHNGCVVKTIGDAVMASFTNPVDALRAAAGIMRRFHTDRADTSILLRASLNTGPCIAVNLNSGIDYFGGTVNIASKLQACAGAGQIAFSKATFDSPAVKEMLHHAGVHLAKRNFEHAALPTAIAVYRWDVHAELETTDAAPVEKSADVRAKS